VAVERLLFVCTGNICRSPMAQAIAASLLARRGADVTVESAGLLSPGERAPHEVEAVLLRRELALPDHRSRRLESVLESPPDLVVAMAREHARAVVALRPDLFGRTFTLKEFVRRAGQENRRRPDERIDVYLARIQQGRKPWDHAGRHAEDDVADPIGRPRRVYERCAAEIEELVAALVDHAWPVGAPAVPGPRS
jgi:protein-tyrosine phosphatase